MTKNKTQSEPGAKNERKSSHDITRLVTLAGVFSLMVLAFWILRSIDQIGLGLDGRLSRIEKQLENIAGKAENAEVRTPPRRGPDPDRVYNVNIAGRPAEGSPAAAITIAEFSDFQ